MVNESVTEISAVWAYTPVLLVDAGITTDPASLAAGGVDHARLILACPVTASDAWGIVETIIRSNSVDLIVVSLLGVMTAPGATPALARRGLTRLAAALHGRQTALLLLSTPLHRAFGTEHGRLPPDVPTIGGPTVAHAAALRILLVPAPPRLTAYGAIATLRAQAAVVKHHGLPRGPLLPLEFTEQGVHRAHECVALGLATHVLQETALGLTFDGDVLGRTPVRAAAYLAQSPALVDALEKRIGTAWTRLHMDTDTPSHSGVA